MHKTLPFAMLLVIVFFQTFAFAENQCSLEFSEVADIELSRITIHRVDVEASLNLDDGGKSRYFHEVKIYFTGLGLPLENILEMRSLISFEGVISPKENAPEIKSVFGYAQLKIPYKNKFEKDIRNAKYKLAYPGKYFWSKIHDRGIVDARSPGRKNRAAELEEEYLKFAIGLHSQGREIYYAFLIAIFGQDAKQFLSNGDRVDLYGKNRKTEDFSLLLDEPLKGFGRDGDITGFLNGYSNNELLIDVVGLGQFHIYRTKAQSGSC